MGRFNNMSVFQAAVEAYGVEEAEGFMENLHRGSVAKAVMGDENEFVDPGHLNEDQRSKMIAYLESVADKAPKLGMAS